MGTIEEIGRRSGGEVARLSLGPIHAYLVTRPEHVERVLSANAANYRREGLMWRPLSRLVGEPSGADPEWPIKRDTFAALLSGPNIATVTDAMSDRIGRAVDELGERAWDGRRLDTSVEMNRIVYRAITEIFVGGKLSLDDVDELGAAITTATTSSFRARMLLPFVPHAVPLPGDRAFKNAVRAVDDLIFPIVRAARRGNDADNGGDDIVSRLLAARGEGDRALGDRGVRDGIVSLFVAGTETTMTALTFLWGALDAHPDVARRLYDEIDEVVGAGRPRRAHLPRLVYTKMVLEELLRLYSVGWILPRVVVSDDVVGGVRIPAGSTVLVSPYLTHRLPDVWPDPGVFDPERFAPHREERRNRFAYLAFGAGPHRCVGSFFFTVEAALIVATILTRYRPVLDAARPDAGRLPAAQPGLTLKPRRHAEISLTSR
ncbi:MAG TPA: cytochrome P450 [Streptosporangiaceae bacterium]|jgi:cytochrome P450